MSCALLRWRCQSSPLSLSLPSFVPLFPSLLLIDLFVVAKKNPISFYECQRAREGESERASSVTRHIERGSEREREWEGEHKLRQLSGYVCVLERAQTRERQVTSLLLGAHERDLFLPMWAHVCVPLRARACVCVCESVQCTVYSWYWLCSKRGAAVPTKELIKWRFHYFIHMSS